MDTKGIHLLVEYYGCDERALNDLEYLRSMFEKAAKEARATVIKTVFQRFEPQGVSGVVVVSESHLTIHTWPEQGYASVDFYTCGNCDPHLAVPYIRGGLGAEGSEVMEIRRGLSPHGDRIGLELAAHQWRGEVEGGGDDIPTP